MTPLAPLPRIDKNPFLCYVELSLLSNSGKSGRTFYYSPTGDQYCAQGDLGILVQRQTYREVKERVVKVERLKDISSREKAMPSSWLHVNPQAVKTTYAFTLTMAGLVGAIMVLGYSHLHELHTWPEAFGYAVVGGLGAMVFQTVGASIVLLNFLLHAMRSKKYLAFWLEPHIGVKFGVVGGSLNQEHTFEEIGAPEKVALISLNPFKTSWITDRGEGEEYHWLATRARVAQKVHTGTYGPLEIDRIILTDARNQLVTLSAKNVLRYSNYITGESWTTGLLVNSLDEKIGGLDSRIDTLEKRKNGL